MASGNKVFLQQLRQAAERIRADLELAKNADNHRDAAATEQEANDVHLESTARGVGS